MTNRYIDSLVGGVPSLGYAANGGPQMSVPSLGSAALITSGDSGLSINSEGQTVKQKGNLPIAVKLNVIPWPDMMHNQMFKGMPVAANAVKQGMDPRLHVLAPLGYINASSIRNFQRHEEELSELLPQINEHWYESPIRGLLNKHREKNLSKAYYGPSTLENAQKALDEHKAAMRRNNNGGMQAILKLLEEELRLARDNRSGRERFYKEFENKVHRDRKNEFSVCTVGRFISEWKVLGPVLSITSDKRDQLTQSTLNTGTTVGLAAGGFTDTLNVWSNNITLGTHLWFIVKPQKHHDGSSGAPIFIPWENPTPFDKSKPPLSVRHYQTSQGLNAYGHAICYGVVAEEPLYLAKSAQFKRAAMGLSGEEWKEIRDSFAVLDMIRVELIKKKDVHF